MQRCPNCGAYVMSGDNICPRCDHPLSGVPVDAEGLLAPVETQPDDAEHLLALEPEAEPDDTEEVFVADSAAQPAIMSDESPPDVETPDAPDAEPEESARPAEDSAPPEGRARHPMARLPNAAPIFRPESAASTAGSAANRQASAPDANRDAPLTGDDVAPEIVPPEDDLRDLQALVTELDRDSPEASPDAEPALVAAEEVLESAPEADEGPPTTRPRLSAELGEAADSEITTERFEPGERGPAAHADPGTTQPSVSMPVVSGARPYIVPPAPYTPPPLPAPPPPVSIMPPPSYIPPGSVALPPSGVTFLQQRAQEYTRGGYRLRARSPYEAVLSCGKSLGVGAWLLALISLIGVFWYLLLLALSSFRADLVYIVLEDDGYVYEDGPGAAHIRQQRARVGRRWSAFGLIIFFACLLLAILLGIVAGIALTQERYQAALREAYPAVTLFEDHFSSAEAAPDDVSLAKDGAVAFAIAGGIAVVGLWGGATLFVIGSVHASAYRARVLPLPGY
jgi:hypothetical protein